MLNIKFLLLVLLLGIFGIVLATVSEVNEKVQDCSHAICHGDFACPPPYFFHKPKGHCCFDCVLDCSTVKCEKNLMCKSGPPNYKAGGRFCCDYCLNY